MNRRVGVLGGTFDPIHRGHLDLGDAAQATLELTTLFVVPSYTPPHRESPKASPFHRFAMVAIAVEERHGWQASDIELEQAERSYTVSTLGRFHAAGYEARELFFIIGADAFADIVSWKDYPALLDSAHFVVVSRPGHPVSQLRQRLPDLQSRIAEAPARAAAGPTTSIILIDAPTADVSATAIRRRLADGLSIAGMVPAQVQQHIEQHGLYAPRALHGRDTASTMNLAAERLHGQG